MHHLNPCLSHQSSSEFRVTGKCVVTLKHNAQIHLGCCSLTALILRLSDGFQNPFSSSTTPFLEQIGRVSRLQGVVKLLRLIQERDILDSSCSATRSSNPERNLGIENRIPQQQQAQLCLLRQRFANGEAFGCSEHCNRIISGDGTTIRCTIHRQFDNLDTQHLKSCTLSRLCVRVPVDK